MIGGTAASIASLLGYFIARLLGERGAVFLVGKTDLERTRHFYERWGFACTAFGRAIGGPAEYLVVVAGLTRIPFRTVFLAIVMVGVTWVILVGAVSEWRVEKQRLSW
jgi:membrane protein DedA with SNARE-associated domain